MQLAQVLRPRSGELGIQSQVLQHLKVNLRQRKLGAATSRSKSEKNWDDENIQRDTLEKFGRELGVKQLDDWYSIKSRNVVNKLGFIRTHYNSSLQKALMTLYPQHNWDHLRFLRVPRGYWSEDAQRLALEKLGREEFGVKELDDWYAVHSEDVSHKLSFIPNHYRGSLHDALLKLYPHHNWDKFRFTKVPKGSWDDENTQRAALERFGREELGVKELDDWYSVSSGVVRRKLSFFKKYGYLYEALKTLYPEHNWDPHRFRIVPNDWTENARKDALEKLGRELGVKELDDWYSVSPEKVRNELGFMCKYGSLLDALKKFYPQHNWDALRFNRVPRGYWQQPNTIQHYHNIFTQWKQVYELRTVSDWYALPPHQVNAFKRAALGIFGSRMKLLEQWFPDTIWRSQYTTQLELQQLLRAVIADTSVKRYRQNDQKSNTMKRMPLMLLELNKS